ncbi:glycosyltransferase family 2 protein [Enterobacter cloacae complex sp. 363J6]|uniref:glycosyltransferase family 2 protein n=1 Tax=Enterobacter cloacae complex sp. 363J6 TaxID=3395868 RepID=UPI003CEF1B5A
MMILSIIITLYNRKELVTRAIESVVKLAEDYNVEIIIIDDGSNDNPLEKISTYLTKDNVYYYYKENGGAGDAKNFGANLANGKYIIFLDSDDYLINTQNLLKLINDKIKEDYDFLYSKSVIIKRNESEVEIFSADRDEIEDDLYKYMLRYPLHYPGKPTYIFKRVAFIDSKGFNANFRWGDAMLFWRKFLKNKSYHEISFPTYVYDQSGSDSVSRNRDSTFYRKVYETLSYTYEDIEKELTQNKSNVNWVVILFLLSLQQLNFNHALKYFSIMCFNPLRTLKTLSFLVRKRKQK